MKITHVVRGEEWLPSAPTHVMLYRFFGWEDTMPSFAHLPLVLKPEGNGKLSKRDGDRLGFPIYTLDWENPLTGEKISGLSERGFLPEAYMNFLALLGWHPGGDREVMNPDELVAEFSLERVGKSGARFDPEKAKWINQQHIKRKTGQELAALLQPTLAKHGIVSTPEYTAAVCELMKERAVFIPDLYEMGLFFFQDELTYDETTIRKKWKKENAEIFENIAESLNLLPNFTEAELEHSVHTLIAEKGLKTGEVMPILRVALAGGLQGPPVYSMMQLLGKEKSVERLKKGFQMFNTL
jgi:glutamyl-tRNA synthetase